MLGYIFRTMLKRSSRNILLLVGLLALSSGLSTYVSANQNASLRVNAALDDHWRGAFDILVRPTDATQPTEQQYGLVEGNYLSVGKSGKSGKSGISVQQWKRIQALSNVEIAAPVATIGYLRNFAGKLTLEVPPQTATSLYRITVAISSTNGYRTTSLVNKNQYYLITPKGGNSGLLDGNNLLVQMQPHERNMGQSNISQVGQNKQVVITPVFAGGTTPDGAVFADVYTPPTIWTLVAAVDPASERKLVNLDKAIVGGEYLSDNDGYTTEKVPQSGSTGTQNQADNGKLLEEMRNQDLNPNGPNIPIIFAASTYVSLPTNIRVDKMQTIDQPTLAKLESAVNAMRDPVTGLYFEDPATVQSKFLDGLNLPILASPVNSSLDFGAVLKPMSYRPLNVSLFPGKPAIQLDPGFSQFDVKNIDKTFRPGAISYSPQRPPFDTGGILSLAAVPQPNAQTIITGTGEVAFRSLPEAPPAMAATPKGGTLNFTSPFSFQEVGTYDLNKLPASVKNQDPLTYVPLGIYQPPLVTLVRDAQGNPLPGGPVPLRPTINPASFIPGPPLALTNIAAARFFRGDNAIDAIRVRVGGIDRYTPENVQKVADVAAQIIKSTGLRVDIVAGSSPQKVLVYIPGSPDGKVAPLGYVEEPWTTLGAAAAITSGIDRASVLMLGGTGLAGLLYLVSQSLLSTLAKRRELALLGAVGWRRRHISSLVVGEAAVVGLLGGLCASVLGVLLAAGLGLAAPLEQAAGIGLAVLLLYVFASVGPAMWIVRQPVAGLLQRGEVALPSAGGARRGRGRAQTEEAAKAVSDTGSGAGKGWTGVRGLAVFAWRTLYSRRARSLLAGGSLAVATLLLTLISVSLASLGGTLRVTLLGQYVGLQVQAYHLVMVGSAVIMSVLAVADHLAMGVLERKQELALLQAVGWRRGAVRVSILIEGLWLGLIGGVAGALVAVGVLLVSSNGASLLASGWWVVPLSVATMLVLCGLSALYAMSLTARQSLVRAMQQ